MWISIITALICFAISIILFTPSFRGLTFYRPLSFYFLFQGVWCVMNFIISTIWDKSNVMIWINYIGTILFAGYLLFSLYAYYYKDNKSEDTQSNQKEN